MKPHLPNDVFLSELTLMFHNAREQGTVSFCIKRYDGRVKPIPKTRKLRGKVVKKAVIPPPPEKYNCLIRAKLKSSAISTVVTAEEVSKYQSQFIHLLRRSIDGLKKKTKSKKTKVSSQ